MSHMHHCTDCGGTGLYDYSGFGHLDVCETCSGTGWVSEDGAPLELEPELPQELLKDEA